MSDNANLTPLVRGAPSTEGSPDADESARLYSEESEIVEVEAVNPLELAQYLFKAADLEDTRYFNDLGVWLDEKLHVAAAIILGRVYGAYSSFSGSVIVVIIENNTGYSAVFMSWDTPNKRWIHWRVHADLRLPSNKLAKSHSYHYHPGESMAHNERFTVRDRQALEFWLSQVIEDLIQGVPSRFRVAEVVTSAIGFELRCLKEDEESEVQHGN